MQNSSAIKKNGLQGTLMLSVMGLLLSLTLRVNAQNEYSYLRGVGVFEGEAYSGISVSYAGGGDIQISGYAFDESAQNNAIYLRTSALTGENVDLLGPQLDQNDEFRSQPSNGRLAYTVPAITDLALGTTMYDFLGFDDVTTYLRVGVDSDTLKCSSNNNCKVKYNWANTALLWYASPPVVHYGLKSSIYLNTKNAPQYKSETQMSIEVRFDGEAIDMEYDLGIDDVLSTYENMVVGGFSTNTVRNKDVDLKARFRGAGYAFNHELMSTNCKWDGSECYKAMVMPSITSISATGGYLNGG